MPGVQTSKKIEFLNADPEKATEEITEEDVRIFKKITSIELDEQQIGQIVIPPMCLPEQKNVLAVHWHPEFVPMDLIIQRLDGMFPNREEELIIPTQHNVLLPYKGFSGVEVDSYSKGFNLKVQLLLHFESAKLGKQDVIKGMLAHTFKYRSSQLFDFIRTIVKPVTGRLNKAARETGANDTLIRFVQIYVGKIERMIKEHSSTLQPDAIKNKMLRDFFNELRSEYGDPLIDRVQTFLKAVKTIVKANFPLKYFYRTSEFIEEARHIGCGVVIPHPEQFWPVLLAEYDVDGYEVWNPQSRRYTEFLISVVNRKNHEIRRFGKELLVFMGDDTHMGEKVKNPKLQDPEKAGREIGYQPAWDDLVIQKTLIKANFNRKRVIREYKSRITA